MSLDDIAADDGGMTTFIFLRDVKFFLDERHVVGLHHRNLVTVCAQMVGMAVAAAAEWLLVQSSFGLFLGSDPRIVSQNGNFAPLAVVT